jgi:hypothetical protein
LGIPDFGIYNGKVGAREGPKNTLRKIGPFFRDAEVTTDVNLTSQIQGF